MAYDMIAVVMLHMIWGKQYQAYLFDAYPSSDQYSIRNEKNMVSIIPEHQRNSEKATMSPAGQGMSETETQHCTCECGQLGGDSEAGHT